MQVNFNPQQNNQNFGMSMEITKGAKEILRKRRMPDADIDKLAELIDKFEKKPVRVTIDEQNGSLTGLVWLEKKHSSDYTEGFFSSLFRSPIKFIQKVCNKAEKVDNYYNHNRLDEVIK